METYTELSCKKKKTNLTCIVGRNQIHSLRDANPCKGVMPKNMAHKLHLKLHLNVILQNDLETHMLSHLVKEQRGQQSRHL